jgi:hypothetical protein
MTTSRIKRGAVFTLPIWKPRRRGERIQFATVTRVAGSTVWYQIDGGVYTHRTSKQWLEQHEHNPNSVSSLLLRGDQGSGVR